MKKLPFLFACLIGFIALKAQSDSTIVKKIKPFKVYIKTMDNKKIKGTLRSVNDSQLVVGRSRKYQWSIPVEDIQSFSLKRKNSVGRGALVGFDIDGGIGLTGAITGAIIGGMTGTLVRKKFTIGGRKETFLDLQSEIMMKLVKK